MGRIVLGTLFVFAGIFHFLRPQLYLAIMPPGLPMPMLLVYLSGMFEVLGGVGVLVRRTRRLAAWGLVALLLAVWPANIFMALHPERFAGVPAWALWVRLPLQIPLIWWAWLYTGPAARTSLRRGL